MRVSITDVEDYLLMLKDKILKSHKSLKPYIVDVKVIDFKNDGLYARISIYTTTQISRYVNKKILKMLGDDWSVKVTPPTTKIFQTLNIEAEVINYYRMKNLKELMK